MLTSRVTTALADRTRSLGFSGIRRLHDRGEQLRREGRDIIQLAMGRPDFDTPEHIKSAAVAALQAGDVHYTSNFGTPALRKAIAGKLLHENGISADPESDVLVTVGAMQGIHLVAQAFCQAGDEVVLPSPGFPNYVQAIQLAGATPVPVRLRAEDRFQLDPDAVAAAVTDRTKLIVLTTPHNPTGAVWSEESLRAVGHLAVERDLVLVSDEIYEKHVYDGAKHFSLASIPELAGRTITINSFSKTYSMTGWRLGYLVAPAAIINVLVRLVQNSTTCPPSFPQAGAVEALTGRQDVLDEMRNEFARRRRLVIAMLNATPGIELVAPYGAFYAFPKVTVPGWTDVEVTDDLLERAGVAVVPGQAFGSEGTGHIRISYAVPHERLEEGLRRMKDLLERVVS